MDFTLPGPSRRTKASSPAARDIPSAAALLDWYDRHARALPWRIGPAARRRGGRADAYQVWLSEVMLQQTTAKAVGPYFQSFVRRWPTVEALAAAPEQDVLTAWAGLGYYSRARNLHACARIVAGELGGQFPSSAAGLADLPGIGQYTSAAIAAIAFGEAAPVVDGNVERVVARLFAIGEPMPAGKARVYAALRPLVPPDRPGEFAEACMDLGATICTPKRPACALCPWNGACAAHRLGRETEFPVKAAKGARPTRHGTSFVARRADGAILLRRRAAKGLLGGMTEVPGSPWGLDAPPAEPPLPAEWAAAPTPVEHVFTHFRLLVSVQAAKVPQATSAPDGCWWSADLMQEALPTVMRKIIAAGIART